MIWAEILFWAGLAVTLYFGWLYFRDLGDVTQLVLKVKRENALRAIRNEYRFIFAGLAAAVVMVAAHLVWDAGPTWAFIAGLLVVVLFYGFPYFWIHFALRNQAESAQYFSIQEAAPFIHPSSPVMVIVNNGVARAHSDYQLRRPHLAGNDQGLGGENVLMTYCAMANLGQGFIPQIADKDVKLCVLAQHGNNLVMRDETTNEPIQQIYGYRDKDGAGGPAMQPWPTFRMSFHGFQKAYPGGQVFLNVPSKSPLVRLIDNLIDAVFAVSIDQHHREEAPVMDNMSVEDDRLPKKTYVWGIHIGDDAVCYTREFLIEQGFLVNTEIGGRRIVLSWDPIYQSLGAWYNTGPEPVTEIDFWGKSDQGQLERVEWLKSGMFFHVWAEFFPNTDINRVTS